jgi:hypothetical protein
MRAAIAVVGLLVLLSSASTGAWGFDGHRFIAGLAIDLLPPELKPFYEKARVFVTEHSIDPDLWRNAGWIEEPPRHFLDIDAFGKEPPFPELPHDYDAAVAKFGKEMVDKNGLLPWRAAEIHARLRKGFEAVKEGSSPWAADDVKFFSALIAHYAGDAFVPLHAVVNYDGQVTMQHGVHSRFETDLFRQYQAKLRLTPPPVKPVTDAREFVFDALYEGFRLSSAVLDADAKAIGDRDEYDDRYYEAFLAGIQPVLERRLGEAASGIASLIVGAWEQAGKPDMLKDVPRPPRKRKR